VPSRSRARVAGVLGGLRDGVLVDEAGESSDEGSRPGVDEQAWIGQEPKLFGELLYLRGAQDVERHEACSSDLRAGPRLREGDPVDLRVRVVERDDDDRVLSQGLGDRRGESGGERGRLGCRWPGRNL